jgi:hypothetical protein
VLKKSEVFTVSVLIPLNGETEIRGRYLSDIEV